MLSNIYLDRLDQYVEQRLLPEFNLGRRRRRNRAYQVVQNAIARARRHGDHAEVHRLSLTRRLLPSQDPDYRRLRYVRYCDDWLQGFAGPKHEAEEIKSQIARQRSARSAGVCHERAYLHPRKKHRSPTTNRHLLIDP